MTVEERRLWYDFLRHYPVKFYRQRVIDNYIADFFCHQAKLVIEIDGSQHYTAAGQIYDQHRTAELSKHNLLVIRFTNLDIKGVGALVEHNAESKLRMLCCTFVHNTNIACCNAGGLFNKNVDAMLKAENSNFRMEIMRDCGNNSVYQT